jgi:hypothetical protein
MKELIGYKEKEKRYPKDGIYETRFGKLLFKNGLWKLPDGSRDYFNFVDFNVDWYKIIN